MKDEILNSSRRTVLTELNEAFKGIVHNHRYLNKLVKHGEDVISSAEWLLDNIYLIEKEYKTIKFNLPINYFNNLPTIDIEGVNYPRVYALAKNYIEKSQNIIEESELIKFINDQGEIFTIGELWAFPLMLRVALIINLGIITNDMVVLQKQRLGAKDLANTVIDSYSNGKLDILISKLESKYPLKDGEANKGELSNSNYMGEDESLHDGLFSPEFIDKFFNILRDNSIEDERIYKFALDRLKEKENTSFEKEILKDHIKEGNIATAIGITINS